MGLMERQTAALGGTLVTLGVGGGITALALTPGTIGYQLKDVENRIVLSDKLKSGKEWDTWDDLVFAYYRDQNNDWKGNLKNIDYKIPDETKNLLKGKCESLLTSRFWGDNDPNYQFAKKWCSVKETISEKITWNESEFSGDDWQNIASNYHHLPDRDRLYPEFVITNPQGNISKDNAEKFCRDRRSDFYVPGSKTEEVYIAICNKVMTVKEVIKTEKTLLDSTGTGDDETWKIKQENYSSSLKRGQKPVNLFDVFIDEDNSGFSLRDMKNLCEKSLEQTILKGTRRFLIEETSKWCFE